MKRNSKLLLLALMLVGSTIALGITTDKNENIKNIRSTNNEYLCCTR